MTITITNKFNKILILVESEFRQEPEYTSKTSKPNGSINGDPSQVLVMRGTNTCIDPPARTARKWNPPSPHTLLQLHSAKIVPTSTVCH